MLNLELQQSVPWVTAVIHIHHWHLLLLFSPDIDTYFTFPPRIEGWVDLGPLLKICRSCLKLCSARTSHASQAYHWQKVTLFLLKLFPCPLIISIICNNCFVIALQPKPIDVQVISHNMQRYAVWFGGSMLAYTVWISLCVLHYILQCVQVFLNDWQSV